jgi:hypothetical protein
MRGCSAPKNSSLRLRPGEFRPLEMRAGSAGFQLHGQFGSSRPLFTLFRVSVADFCCRQLEGPQRVPGYQKRLYPTPLWRFTAPYRPSQSIA